MNETVFRELLRESLQREYAEFDNPPEHIFSILHCVSLFVFFSLF